MKKNETTFVIILLTILLTLFGAGMMKPDHYGFQTMCAHIGGIWCYWPSGRLRIFMIIIVIVALTLFITWLIKQLQNQKRK